MAFVSDMVSHSRPIRISGYHDMAALGTRGWQTAGEGLTGVLSSEL
ncbi:hypothetical protein OOT00_00915 [Desulfobotulus sp. H1]|uniref:Uncharacterized protein n=1 Tax=Desulfobotulus pelophilus TaxID=2823377 RepID=A0ABT3N502_9BACT|nr:hypothetical protein [Desulfobotulus pelophilus]MCW7752540.1 hypothetical protein [Desulfobotulus pelophilus]